jgi:PHD/YefM family antitoxin component YafN of YafNO toxin-antitoxin module
MTRLNASEARSDFSSTVNRVAYGKDRVVLHRRGKDLQLLEELEARVDLDEARAALKEADKKGTIAWERIKKDLGL